MGVVGVAVLAAAAVMMVIQQHLEQAWKTWSLRPRK